MLTLGADVNRVVERHFVDLLTLAAFYGHPAELRVIATAPGVMLDIQVRVYFCMCLVP